MTDRKPKNTDVTKPAPAAAVATRTTAIASSSASSAQRQEQKQPDPRPNLMRQDTFARLTAKQKSFKMPSAQRDEYDADGWFIYRGNGEVLNKNVTRIKIVESAVTHIPDKAFCGCASLTTVRFDSKTIKTMGQFAFYECSKLAEIHLPNTITSIGEYAFSGCSSLTTLQLPFSLSSIEEGTFSDCPSLTSLLIPDSITFIGLYAFYGCFSLTNVLLSVSIKSIGEEAFEGCEALLGLCDPGLTIKEWLKLRYFNLPLHRRCYLPGITDLEVLVFKKQVDIVDGSKMNPLHILALNPAAAFDTSSILDMIRSMLSNSTNRQQLISARDRQGRTPLHYACLNPCVTLAMILAMVDKNPSSCLSTQDKMNKYPTALAIDFHRPLEIQQWLYRYQPVESKDLRFGGVESDEKIRALASKYIVDLTKRRDQNGADEFVTNFPPEEQHGWVQFVSQLKDDDLVEELIDFIRGCERSSSKALASARDYQRRSAISVAVGGVKEALESALLFCGRFEIEQRPRYETKSNLVYFAMDMISKTSGDSGGTPVALKFFRKKEDFEAERRARLHNPEEVSSKRFESEYVMELVGVYDGDKDKVAQMEAVKSEVPPYFLVLEQGERNLAEAIQGEHLTAHPLSVSSTLHELAKCLQHMHSMGFVHGNFKPRNLVRRIHNTRRWCLIGLTAATEIGNAASTMHASPAYMPPEAIKVESKEPVFLAIPVYPSFDVWSFGVIMYQMVSEKLHLFEGVDIFDNLNKMGLKKLANWDSGDMKENLNNLNGPARDLLFKILTKKPDKRPSMDEILADPFFSPVRRLAELKSLLANAQSDNNNAMVDEIKREIEDLKKDWKEMSNRSPLEKRSYFQDWYRSVRGSGNRRSPTKRRLSGECTSTRDFPIPRGTRRASIGGATMSSAGGGRSRSKTCTAKVA